MDTRRLLGTLLDGPPPALPRPLDAAAEGWAAARPRTRVALGVLGAALLLAVAGRGAARSPWGPPTPVVVAAADLPAGRAVAPTDVVVATWPQEVVPAGAARDAIEVVGRTLARGVPASIPLTAGHLLRPGVAGDLPAGTVAFPLPYEGDLALAPGLRLDLLGVQTDGAGVRLATGATILGVEETTVWIAVAREEAPGVAAAAALGEVTVVLLPP